MIDLTLSPLDVNNLQAAIDVQRPLYFLGIGGAGMSPLAIAFSALGFDVSGSDVSDSVALQGLQARGIRTFVGHAAHQLPQNATLVYSTAISDSVPEWQLAQAKGYPCLHRSQLLQVLLHDARYGNALTVGLAGTHGKTTLTGMMDAVLVAAQQEALVLAGGRLPSEESQRHCGNLRLSTAGQLAVAELDESDGSLLRYAPTISIVSNLELDHADHYSQGSSGLETLKTTFETYFSNLAHAQGTATVSPLVILNANCPLTREVAHAIPNTVAVQWLLLAEEPHPPLTPWMLERGELIRLENLANAEQAAQLLRVSDGKATPLGSFQLSITGKHNLWNAGMVALAARRLDLPWAAISEGLQRFSGMGRRFERIPQTQTPAVLVDDYGHHPTEVAVTLQAARQYMQQQGLQGRLKLWFQPHRYSRLQALWQDFLTCFDAADDLYLVDVYAAHEAPIAGVDSVALAAALEASGRSVSAVGSVAMAQQTALPHLAAGDLALSMGAGDITRLWRGELPA